MKKSVILIVFVLLAGYNLMCNGKREMSELVLTNVEALASGESSTDCESGGSGCLSGGRWFPYDREPW